MVRPNEIVDAIIFEVQDSGRMPETASYIDRIPDIDTDALKLPIIEVSLLDTTSLTSFNSDFVGYRTNDSGDEIGRIYDSDYLATIEASLWTAQGSKYNPEILSNDLRTLLYEFDTNVGQATLRHPDLGDLDEVWRFSLESGTHTDDLTTTPPLRKWTETISVYAIEEHTTYEPLTIRTTEQEVDTL